jgi:DNA-binding transcriptional MerR regulator
MTMTANTLARACGLSRSTLLYYESLGLLRRPPRTDGNYRAYGDADLARLRQIGVYRKVGLRLASIRAVLDQPRGDASAILERRLVEIDADIETLRAHQRDILRLLERSRPLARRAPMTKDTWVGIMRRAGFTDAAMHTWHAEFERTAPADHQEFLEFLHIPADEVRAIRARSGAARPAAPPRARHPRR